MKERCVVFCAMDEFHHFSRTNVWIHAQLRGRYKEIIAVAPMAATAILSAVDLVVTDSSTTHDLYPGILKIMDESRNLYAYRKTDIFARTLRYLKDTYIDDFYMYTGTETDHEGLNEIFNSKVQLVLSPGISQDFGLIANFLRAGREVLPFTEDVNEILSRYSNFFQAERKTLVVLTRNFSAKQPFYNSNEREVRRLVKKAMRIGFNVLNIGVPPLSIDLSELTKKTVRRRFIKEKSSRLTWEPRYVEIDGLTYSETLAVAALGDVWAIVPHAGGFSIHVCSQGNLIISGKEFCQTDQGEWLKDVRKSIRSKPTFSTLREFKKWASSTNYQRDPERIRSVLRADKVVDLAEVL